MAKYLNPTSLYEMDEARKRIFADRETIYKKFKVDILDTDALSSLSIYNIVKQYDPNYNINFARNGEDAKSGETLIEHKASRVEGSFTTKTGKLRKNAGLDAAFQFHAMGDLEHQRYIFVARCKDDLSILRMYDISNKDNCKKIINHLMSERQKWLDRSSGDPSKMKRDIILISEKQILEQIKFNNTTIDNVVVYRDMV